MSSRGAVSPRGVAMPSPNVVRRPSAGSRNAKKSAGAAQTWVQPVFPESDDTPCRRLLNAVDKALRLDGAQVETMRDCVGGTYQINAPGRANKEMPIAMVKMSAEEPGTKGNSKGHTSRLRRGFVPGLLCVNEAATYVLDCYSEEFAAGVPPATTAWIAGELASVQKFVSNTGDAEDFGPGAFPVEVVQRLAVLDLRVANCDRHTGNVLVVQERASGKVTTLIPIDHAYCLPACLAECYFEWMLWPQAAAPLSPELREFVRNLDGKADANLLRQSFPGGITEAALLVVRVTAAFLSRAVGEHGISLHDAAQAMTRPYDGSICALETMAIRAQEKLLVPATPNAALVQQAAVHNAEEHTADGELLGWDPEVIARSSEQTHDAFIEALVEEIDDVFGA